MTNCIQSIFDFIYQAYAQDCKEGNRAAAGTYDLDTPSMDAGVNGPQLEGEASPDTQGLRDPPALGLSLGLESMSEEKSVSGEAVINQQLQKLSPRENGLGYHTFSNRFDVYHHGDFIALQKLEFEWVCKVCQSELYRAY